MEPRTNCARRCDGWGEDGGGVKEEAKRGAKGGAWKAEAGSSPLWTDGGKVMRDSFCESALRALSISTSTKMESATVPVSIEV